MGSEAERNKEVDELYKELGRLAYEIGKQQEVANKEAVKLRELQVKANEKATEIEELGERDMA